VVDDGRGIDPVVISKAAIRLAVTTEGSLLDMQQSLRLIFRPGFSTATSVSGISGRGVGLDVVETAVEQVGGEVVVDSSPGVGSTFGIRLPVTFGLQQVVHISCANQPYLLDKTLIVSCRDFDDREIEATESGKVLRVDDELLPLVDLHQLLGRPPADSERGQGLLVCQIAREASDGTNSFERIGLLVDAIKETQQVLVRNLGSRGARWFGVAGAAELRDGSVALLLDVPRLLTL
jgi:two-component system chemotaxis sensor kinase CheA